MKVLFVGHFGARNLGDELLLLSQIQMFKAICAELFTAYVYSYDLKTDYYNDYPVKVKQVPGFSYKMFFRSILSIYRTVKSVDFIIVGGGGVIQDQYFVYRPLSTLLPALFAFIFNKPVYGFSLGIYKLNLNLNKRLVRFFLKNANYITYRDTASEITINELLKGDKVKSIKRVPDSAIGVTYSFSQTSIDEGKPYILVAIREVFETKMSELIAILSKCISETKAKKVILVTFENSIEEETVLSVLKKNISAMIKVEIIDFPTVETYLGLVKSANMVIAGRLHACIPAYVLDKEVLGLAYEVKVSDFCYSHGLRYADINDLTNQVKGKRKLSKVQEVKELESYVEYILKDKERFISKTLFVKLESLLLIAGSMIVSFFIHLLKIDYRRK